MAKRNKLTGDESQAINKADMTKEVSKIQSRKDQAYKDMLRGAGYYDRYRKISEDPTVALARVASVAPIAAAEWSVVADEDAPESAKELIEKTFIPARPQLLEPVLFFGYVDYGWTGFEKIWERQEGGLITVRKFKPLLADLTKIQIDDHGNFLGYKQGDIEISLPKSLHYAFRVEGQNWYGKSLYENILPTMQAYWKNEQAAQRYDEKVAGAIRVLHHRAGEVVVNGALMDASEAADRILATMVRSGDMAIPHQPGDLVNGSDPWRLEYIEAKGGAHSGFIERARYLDSLKVRGMLQSERSILEGQMGTKAEAAEHASLTLTNAELVHKEITRNTNWHAVDPILEANWGKAARGKVKLIPSPIVDTKKESFQKLLESIMSNPSGFVAAFSMLDIPAMIEALGLPTLSDEPLLTAPAMMDEDAMIGTNLEAYTKQLLATDEA